MTDEQWQILRQQEERLTPNERSEYDALFSRTVKLTEKQMRERRLKLPKRHEQQKWDLLQAYMLSPTQELSSQLSQLGFDEITKDLLRLTALQRKAFGPRRRKKPSVPPDTKHDA